MDLLRDRQERRRAADVRALLEGNRQYVGARITETLAKYDSIVDSAGPADLSRAADAIRARMNWPPTGPVRGLPGATDELRHAVEAVEASNGAMPFKQAVKVLAALDPEGMEAAYLKWREEQGRLLA